MTTGLPDVPPIQQPGMSDFLQAMRQRLLQTTSGNVSSVNGKTGDVTVAVPVTSVNGQIGDVTVSVPVTSVNGQVGDVVLTFPVTSVNGQTGAVTLTFPVTSVNGLTGAVTLGFRAVAGAASIKDYGAVCDGSTDDTSAWNSAISAINAGTINSVFVPGFSCVSGSLTTITKSVTIWGTGHASSGLVHTGGGDVTMLAINLASDYGEVCIRDVGLRSTQTNVGQALYIRHPSNHSKTSLRDINIWHWGSDESKGFNRGVELINCVDGDFANVHFVGPVNFGLSYPSSVLISAWAWYAHAETGKYCVNCRWSNCDVYQTTLAWKGAGHLEGFSWVTCCPVFVGQPWQMLVTDTSLAPYFEWVNCQCEFWNQGLQADNVAYVNVTGCQFFNDADLATNRTSVLLSNAYYVKVDNNIQVAANNLGSSGFLKLLNVNTAMSTNNLGTAAATGSSSSAGVGIWFTGTTQNAFSFNDILNGLGTGSVLYTNDSSNAGTNRKVNP